MPNNLLDDPTTFPGPIQAPAPGDPRTDTSVATPLQQLANRTSNNKARLDAIAPFSAPGVFAPSGCTSGVTNLLRTSTTTTLMGIPAVNRTDGMIVEVDGDGIFQFRITSTTSPDGVWVFRPADVSGGSPGRWFRLNYGALGVANGLPQLDNAGRLPAGLSHNGIVVIGTASPTNLLTASSTYIDVSGSTITLTGLAPGDVIVAQFSAFVLVNNAQDAATPSLNYMRGVVNDPGAVDHTFANGEFRVSNGDPNANASACLAGSVFFTVASAGTHTVRWQALVQTFGGGLGSFLNQNFLAYAIRA